MNENPETPPFPDEASAEPALASQAAPANDVAKPVRRTRAVKPAVEVSGPAGSAEVPGAGATAVDTGGADAGAPPKPARRKRAAAVTDVPAPVADVSPAPVVIPASPVATS